MILLIYFCLLLQSITQSSQLGVVFSFLILLLLLLLLLFHHHHLLLLLLLLLIWMVSKIPRVSYRSQHVNSGHGRHYSKLNNDFVAVVSVIGIVPFQTDSSSVGRVIHHQRGGWGGEEGG